MTIAAVVLAAGRSRRMGSPNKLLLPVNDRPMIAQVVDRVCQSRASSVVVVTGYQSRQIRGALADCPVDFAHNADFARGKATSIRAGVRAAPAAADGFMICLGDLPDLRAQDHDRIMAEFEQALSQDRRAIVRPTFKGIPGHPVVIAAAHSDGLTRNVLRAGCRNVVRRHPQHVRKIAWNNDRVIKDVDTPDRYEELSA